MTHEAGDRGTECRTGDMGHRFIAGNLDSEVALRRLTKSFMQTRRKPEGQGLEGTSIEQASEVGQ